MLGFTSLAAPRTVRRRLARLSKARMFDEMKAYNVFDCVECGCCTFACPSSIPIVQLIRTAKDDLRHRKEPEE